MLPSQLTRPFTHFPPPSYNTPPSVHSALVQPGILSAITPSSLPVPPYEIPSGLHSDLSKQRVSSCPRLIAPRPTLDTIVSTRPCLPTVSGSGDQLPPILSSVAFDSFVESGMFPVSQFHSSPGPSTNELTETDPHGQRSIPYLPPGSVQPSTPAKRPGPSETLPQPKRHMRDSDTDSVHIINQALKLLRDDFELRQSASAAFPPVLSESQARASVGRYQVHMENASQQGVCSSCGRFVPVSEIVEMENGNPLLEPLAGHLDYCGKHDDEWDVCLTCLKSLSQNTLPKFSALNRVNMTMCQNYPTVLESLTPVEECLIARCHPLGILLKLRPGGRASPISYRALRGHFIVIPQDPEPLLEILPSPALRLHDVFRVFWLGKQPATYTDLSPFLLVRKHRVVAALPYLTRHNHVYYNVTINHDMIGTWDDDFIPADLQENIISVDQPDGHEREGYSVHLDTGNYENDFQAAQASDLDMDSNAPLIAGSVSTDINGERQNPDRRLLNALLNVVSSPSASSTKRTLRHGQQRIPSLSYRIQGQATLVDHWYDPTYFTHCRLSSFVCAWFWRPSGRPST